ncbi:flagellar hook-length control protein FliK [Campylobacter sp. RM16187]|uniref:flagellar hook-length control protein FliK n=1 Tax=Campylobacter sp. RM16187 TaxID=1660063 RepID=UPI0021B50A69|nr:flagellar hook-length control protein FliK [Campylobacter sp. RM16187]QKG29002.1 putative C-terminal FliK domain protein [Campylobacter sp. RM16187]
MEILRNLTSAKIGLDPNQLKGSETKDSKALFKNHPQNLPTQIDSEVSANDIGDINKLVNRLLDELKTSSSGAKMAEIANQAKDLQVAPNLVKDLKSLIKLADQNSELKPFIDKLKTFLKPISELKASALNEQIKNSGIMLEANLKDVIVNKNILPVSINKLFDDIKNLYNSKLLNQILTLAKDDSLNTNESFEKLSEILKNAKIQNKEILNNSSIKSLLENSAKLENIVKFLDKQANAMSEKGLILSEKAVKNEINKINELIANLKTKIPEISTEKLSQNRAYSSNLKELSNLINEVEKAIENTVNQPNVINSFVEQILNKGFSVENFSLQDRLKAVANKLNQALNLADKIGFEAKTNMDEINRLSKQQNLAQKDIKNIQPKITEESIKALQNDVKSVLLNIQTKSVSDPNSQINQLSSKLIAQIEMHQLVSSMAGGIETYLPYVWDDVDGAKIAFKRGKKQKHYAQIDLNFQKLGSINIVLGLSENRYIDISIATQKEEFKQLILSGAKELKRVINDQGLILSNFSLKTMPKLSLNTLYNDFDRLNMGFDRII